MVPSIKNSSHNVQHLFPMGLLSLSLTIRSPFVNGSSSCTVRNLSCVSSLTVLVAYTHPSSLYSTLVPPSTTETRSSRTWRCTSRPDAPRREAPSALRQVPQIVPVVVSVRPLLHSYLNSIFSSNPFLSILRHLQSVSNPVLYIERQTYILHSRFLLVPTQRKKG